MPPASPTDPESQLAPSHESRDVSGTLPARDRVAADVCAVVLAGSYRWGDSAFARILRGPLLPVAQTPIICYPLHWLAKDGVSEAVICANSATPAVQQALGNGDRMSMKLKYFEDDSPRGPAGCARDATRYSAAQTFIVVEGSMIPLLSLRTLLEAHRQSGAAATVVTETERRKQPVGVERPQLPGGIYVFERRVLEAVSDHGFQDIKQGLLDSLYKRGEPVLTHQVLGIAPRVLDHETYASVNRWLITRAIESPAFLPGYLRVDEGLHHPTAHVEVGARLIGPVILGRNSRIASGAVVVGPTSIGAESIVEAGALVTRSIVWEHCTVGGNAIVEGSMLADHSVVNNGQELFGSVVLSPSLGEETPIPAIDIPTASWTAASLSKLLGRPRPGITVGHGSVVR
jgi:NDP-sugar pyrophosphorylase family protein